MKVFLKLGKYFISDSSDILCCGVQYLYLKSGNLLIEYDFNYCEYFEERSWIAWMCLQ